MTVELGPVIYSSVKPIFKIYIIIGMGFWLAKRNILSVSTTRDISDTLVRCILPCLIFNKVVTYLESSDIKNVGIIFFIGTLLFFTGFVFTYLLSILARLPKRWLGGLLSVGLFPNISDLPIAYMQTLSNGGLVFTEQQGDKGVAYIIIFLACMALFQFTLGLYELIEWDFRPNIKDDEDKATEKSTEKSFSDNESIDNLSQNNPTKDTKNEKNVTHIPLRLHDIPGNEMSMDEVSISSSIENETFQPPPPTELGVDTSQTASNLFHHRLSHRVSQRRASVNDSIGEVLLQVRSKDLRLMKTQDMNDVINEYSEYDSMRLSEAKPVMSVSTDVGGAGIITIMSNSNEQLLMKQRVKTRLKLMAKNLISPVSATLIASIAISMSPPLKALFVKSHFHLPNAPDGNPPLSFIIDTTSYVGNASVPFGLLLLGATISRLEVKTMPKGFWKTAIGITLIRLVILPIFGVGVVAGINKAGWYDGDSLLRFICVLEYGLPSATSLVYFTAFYTDPNSTDHLQMDCLAVALIAQYCLLFVSLPFLVTFTIKVSLGF